MTEKFLHYLWSMKLLHSAGLQTTTGEKITVIKSGEWNTDAGPDFINAKIMIGETLWAGNVEIHLKASDWKTHQHHQDGAYDNIILHAVYDNDVPAVRSDGSIIPCLEMKNHFDASLYERYSTLLASKTWIPCERQLHQVPEFIRLQWMHRLLVERMEEKIQPVLAALEENKHNWEECFYQSVAMSFGNRINTLPFLLLAKALPVKVLARHKNNLFQLEALLFGTAGFLDESFTDEYPNLLKQEFRFQKKKYGLQPLKKHAWKFLRLRPANFPTIRIAQFARLVNKSSHLFSQMIAADNAKALTALFGTTASEYWNTHYRFDKVSNAKIKEFGSASINLLLVNTVSPFLFVYGRKKSDDLYIERSLELLTHLKAEKNAITDRWLQSGIRAKSAFESQALLQLYHDYCKHFRCLECAIGHRILNTTGV